MHRWNFNRYLTFKVIGDLGVMVLNGYFAFHRGPGLETLHKMVLCYVLDLLWQTVLPLTRDEIGAFDSPS